MRQIEEGLFSFYGANKAKAKTENAPKTDETKQPVPLVAPFDIPFARVNSVMDESPAASVSQFYPIC